MKTIKKQFHECDKIKIFEISVINKKTSSPDWIIFDISISGNYFVVQHEPLTKKEQNSKFIARKTMLIDPDFSLDCNLQGLYEICLNAILCSDFFELQENN